MMQPVRGSVCKGMVLAAAVALAPAMAGGAARGLQHQAANAPSLPAATHTGLPVPTRPIVRRQSQHPPAAPAPAVRAAPTPLLFWSVADSIKSGTVSEAFNFPGGNGPKDFQLDGWTYAHIEPAEHPPRAATGAHGAGVPAKGTSFSLAFLACRNGNRFVMVANLSDRAMVYFCSAGSKRMTVLLPLLGDGPILWTDQGGTFVRVSAAKTKASGRLHLSVGYSRRPPKVEFLANEGAIIACALRRSEAISYNGWRRFLSATLGASGNCGWIAAHFDPPPGGSRGLPPEIADLEFGVVAVLPKGRGIGGNDNIIVRQRPAGRGTVYFRTSPKGLGAMGARLSKVSGLKMGVVMHRLLVLVNSHPHRDAGHRAKLAERFLRWSGGSAVEAWYRSGNAKYARTITMASIAPFARAWEAAKGRFRKGFTFVPPGLR